MRVSLGNPKDVDDEGFLVDVNVQPIHQDSPSCKDKQHNVDHFFEPPVVKTINRKMKKYCSCKHCLYVSNISAFFNLVNGTHFSATKKALLMKSQHYITTWRHITQ